MLNYTTWFFNRLSYSKNSSLRGWVDFERGLIRTDEFLTFLYLDFKIILCFNTLGRKVIQASLKNSIIL